MVDCDLLRLKRRTGRRFAPLLPWHHQGAAMGHVAEVLPCQRQQLSLAQGGVIQCHDTGDPLQQLPMVTADVGDEQPAHIRLSLPMAQQQDRVGVGDRVADAFEVVVIEGRPLPGQIPLVAMTEILIPPPEAVGMQHGCLHLFPLKPPEAGSVVIEPYHQPHGLITTRTWRRRLGVLGADAGLLQQTPQAQHPLLIEPGVMQRRCGMQAGDLTGRQAHLQPVIREMLHLGAEAEQQGLHP